MFTLISDDQNQTNGGFVSLIDEPFQNVLETVELPVQVEILLLHHNPPMWLKANLLKVDNEHRDLLHLQLLNQEGPLILPFGAKVILYFTDDKGPMLSLNYYDQQEGLLKLQFSQVHKRDKRIFPRHYGNIPLSFKIIPQAEEELAVKQWTHSVIHVNETWETPEPFMNFSLGGLSFETSYLIAPQTLLLIEMQIGLSEQKWRATSRVVRCIEIAQDHYEIAIEFSELPAGAVEALSELTLQVQEALL